MHKLKTKYEWIIVGGGIGGIAFAEILSRNGHSVLLLEKNAKLASETSKDFHEWLHTGSLYSLVPDKLLTTRYLLGAIDDLLEYYSFFVKQNLVPTSSGFSIIRKGWFNDDKIIYRYRNRRYNFIWSAIVSRSINVVSKIKTHDWLRRKAGALYGETRLSRSSWYSSYRKIFSSKSRFLEIESPDITINSRTLINDLLSNAISNGASVVLNADVTEVSETEHEVVVSCSRGKFISDKVVICAPELIARKFNKEIKLSYAPIAIIKGLPSEANSFVELDYYQKNCINLLRKEDGIGQAGGISLSRAEQVQPYLEYVIAEHKKRNPGIEVIGTYTGIKKEVVLSGQDRGYLYHIDKHSPKVWSSILGKFTLAFSAAPEFYRRVYGVNSIKNSEKTTSNENYHIISETTWHELSGLNKEKW